jgi:hypothetical protein
MPIGQAGRKAISAELQQTIFRGQKESYLENAPHSRRTADAGLRRLGTINLALDGTF